MFSLKPHFCVVAAFLFFAGYIAAQPPPPPAKPGGAPIKIVQDPSLATLTPSERFSSVDGRFSISLPKSISGWGALSPKDLGFNASGGMVQWRLKEGLVLIMFHDFLDPNFTLTTEQNFADYFAGVRDSLLAASKAKLVSSNPIKFGQYRGYIFAFELPNGKKQIVRTFYVDKRAYSLLAIPSEAPDSETLITKAFDTFELLPQVSVDTNLQRKVEAATPKDLPQNPVAPKEKPDTEDEGLNGKVKTVTEEDEDRSGTWGTQGRHMSSIEEYNELGNKTKRIGYDSQGKPFQITVYGYLDGARVSKSQIIEYDDDPPLMIPGAPSAVAKPRDSRYEYKYAYKYVGGKLNERQLIHNNGEKGMRYITNYQGDLMEELVYDDKGNLNMKFLYKLDGKGNEIARAEVDVLKIYGGVDEHYSLRYESFDEHGNWTKKITAKLVNEGGKPTYKDWYVTYRTFKYY